MSVQLTPIQAIVLTVAAASTILGLLIGYQAYRGFRRNEERSMQFLSIGLIFLTAIPYTVSFAGTLLIRVNLLPVQFETPIGLTARLVQLVGLICITYSLYTRP